MVYNKGRLWFIYVILVVFSVIVFQSVCLLCPIFARSQSHLRRSLSAGLCVGLHNEE